MIDAQSRTGCASLGGTPHSDGIRANLAIGLALAILVLAGVGGWAATSSLSGAVLAQGTVVSSSNMKKIQHSSGGIIAEIRVKDGDTVAAGDLLVRLDDTITRANLQVITKQLDELAVRQARLKAERDDAEAMEVPKALYARRNEPNIADIIDGERTLFESRRAGRLGQKAQLQERLTQLREESTGLSARNKAKEKELTLVATELEGLEELWDKRLASITKVTAMRREATRLDGEHAQLDAQAAIIRAKIAETNLQLVQIDRDLRTEVMKDFRETQAKEAELVERRTAAEDQLKRVEIRAPHAGTVHQLSVHTIGGVISPSEPIMLLVPADDTLVVEAKIAPQDVDHIYIGQPAFVRFPAFNQRTTPEFKAELVVLSADVVKDATPGQPHQTYYVGRLRLTDIQKRDHVKLVPGMPAEVHISTADRSALSYLVKPMTDQIARAFKH